MFLVRRDIHTYTNNNRVETKGLRGSIINASLEGVGGGGSVQKHNHFTLKMYEMFIVIFVVKQFSDQNFYDLTHCNLILIADGKVDARYCFVLK